MEALLSGTLRHVLFVFHTAVYRHIIDHSISLFSLVRDAVPVVYCCVLLFLSFDPEREDYNELLLGLYHEVVGVGTPHCASCILFFIFCSSLLLAFQPTVNSSLVRTT